MESAVAQSFDESSHREDEGTVMDKGDLENDNF